MNDFEGTLSWAKQIVEFSANMLVLIRDGRILFMNPGGVKMLGLTSPDPLIGTPFSDLVHTDYRELVDEGMEVLAAEGMPLPLKLHRSDDSYIDAELSVAVASDLQEADFIVEARDISKFIRAAEDTREREETLRGILSTLADSVITIDDQGTIQSLNEAAETLFGCAARQVIGKNVSIFIPEPYAAHHDDYIRNYLKTGEKKILGKTREMEGRRLDGSTFPADISVTELRRGKRHLFIGVIRDISERVEAERKIRHMAHHDALTGLPNRNLFTDRLRNAINRASRAREQVALMYVDLDKFKPINDELGHEAGDIVLKEVAKRLTTTLRKTDTVARVGGDEFVIVLDSPGGAVDPETVAKKILTLVPDPVTVNDGKDTCSVGASIGIALFPDDAADMTELGRCADEAMYAVKQSGRNNYVFYRDTIGNGRT